MIYDTQPMLDTLTDMDGNLWPDSMLASYNNFTHYINQSANIEVVPGSLVDAERTFFLDQRHKHYVQCKDILSHND